MSLVDDSGDLTCKKTVMRNACIFFFFLVMVHQAERLLASFLSSIHALLPYSELVF